MNDKNTTTTFILVHGAWAGSWVWDKIKPALEIAGFQTIAVDLPGKALNDSPPQDISLPVYVHYLCGIIDTIKGDIILVGHSGAGLIISQVAEFRAKRIVDLVYIAGFLLPSGMSFGDFSNCYHPKDDTRLTASDLAIPSSDGFSSHIDPLDAVGLFFNRAEPLDASIAAAKLAPEPNGGRDVGASLTGDNFGNIRKNYIECLDDQTILLPVQRKMQELTHCSKIFSIETDHAPQLSRPDTLIDILLAISLNSQ